MIFIEWQAVTPLRQVILNQDVKRIDKVFIKGFQMKKARAVINLQ